MEYRINGGRTRTTSAREWRGGERYGFENDDYYAEYRGDVRGADAGDEVEVWFIGHLARPAHRRRAGASRASTSPTRSPATPTAPCS